MKHNNFDLLIDDCIQCIIQHLDILNVISLSETSVKLNRICNNFESIKNHIVNLAFNPYNYFPYYEHDTEKNIKQYMNYENYFNVYKYKLLTLDVEHTKSSNNKIIEKNKICSENIQDNILTFPFPINKYKNLCLVLKTDNLLVEPIFDYYEIFFGSMHQITHYEEVPILYKHHNVKYMNEYTIKNGVYKYIIPIIIGIRYVPYGVNTKIIIKLSNNINIHDTYIKCNVYKNEQHVSNEIHRFIMTKHMGTFKFENGQNKITIIPQIYPIKLYFYFNNMTDINTQPFKNLTLSIKDININYKYEHIKKELYLDKYHYCLNFIDNSIDVFANLSAISKCKINKFIYIIFDESCVTKNMNVVFYLLSYNYFIFANGLDMLMYSN